MTSDRLDRFGVAMLFPTAAGGRTWSNAWDNGVPRTLSSGKADLPHDPAFVARGPSTRIEIDGRGVARLAGPQPRMYVYKAGRTWDNVEVTFYAMRVRESGPSDVQGFVAAARSEHQAVTEGDPCPGFGYYGQMLYSGRVNVIKELSHPHYSPNRPPGNPHADWGTDDGTVLYGRWVGFKFVVRNFDRGTKLRLSLYRDMTGGGDGGRWERLLHEADTGDWAVTAPDPRCNLLPAYEVLTRPATSVFVRNTAVEAADYAKFSVREVDPE